MQKLVHADQDLPTGAEDRRWVNRPGDDGFQRITDARSWPNASSHAVRQCQLTSETDYVYRAACAQRWPDDGFVARHESRAGSGRISCIQDCKGMIWESPAPGHALRRRNARSDQTHAPAEDAASRAAFFDDAALRRRIGSAQSAETGKCQCNCDDATSALTGSDGFIDRLRRCRRSHRRRIEGRMVYRFHVMVTDRRIWRPDHCRFRHDRRC